MDGLLESVTVRAESGGPIGTLHTPGPAKAAARAELGIPIDRPIVMAGHQAEMWHTGILAKLIAAAVLAKQHDAALVWLTPDQDGNEPTMVPYPVETHEDRLKRRDWLVDAGAFVRPGTPTGSRLAIEPGVVPREARTEWPHATARDGLGRIREALIARRDEASLAGQFTLAALDVAREVLGIEVDHVLMCSGMARGAAFGMWVDRMRREARNCVLAYNGAAQAVHEAHVRDMEMAPRWELPLWALTPERPRAVVFADEQPEGLVAPRALAMTGFVRTLLCDAWVMGVGGEAYDAVTRRWLNAWMGRDDLAPGVVTTATLRLPLRQGPLPDAERAAKAAWRVHHARHHPRMLGQAERQHERDRLVKAMREAPYASAERRRLFAEMREVLGKARDHGADSLDQMRTEAELERQRLTDMDCVLDRTWPFALHSAESLKELNAQVHEAAGVLA